MQFDEVNEAIPYKVGVQHENELQVYPNVWVSYPGRHQKDTTPPGGDFRVEVTDANLKWNRHPFTHSDLFRDFQIKVEADVKVAQALLHSYYLVIDGAGAPEEWSGGWNKISTPGLNPTTLLEANQVLAVAEHRRYKQYEKKFGGRFLPYRFLCGIVEGLWDAQDAANLQNRGRIGVELLEKYKGTPELTKVLMT